jgi:phosphoserine phosphatase
MVVADGRYTGEVEFYAYGYNKASAIKALAESEGYDLDGCYAYSDSATDLPMLGLVGHPTAVNPDRALRKEVVARGWPSTRRSARTELIYSGLLERRQSSRCGSIHHSSCGRAR